MADHHSLRSLSGGSSQESLQTAAGRFASSDDEQLAGDQLTLAVGRPKSALQCFEPALPASSLRAVPDDGPGPSGPSVRLASSSSGTDARSPRSGRAPPDTGLYTFAGATRLAEAVTWDREDVTNEPEAVYSPRYMDSSEFSARGAAAVLISLPQHAQRARAQGARPSPPVGGERESVTRAHDLRLAQSQRSVGYESCLTQPPEMRRRISGQPPERSAPAQSPPRPSDNATSTGHPPLPQLHPAESTSKHDWQQAATLCQRQVSALTARVETLAGHLAATALADHPQWREPTASVATAPRPIALALDGHPQLRGRATVAESASTMLHRTVYGPPQRSNQGVQDHFEASVRPSSTTGWFVPPADDDIEFTELERAREVHPPSHTGEPFAYGHADVNGNWRTSLKTVGEVAAASKAQHTDPDYRPLPPQSYQRTPARLPVPGYAAAPVQRTSTTWWDPPEAAAADTAAEVAALQATLADLQRETADALRARVAAQLIARDRAIAERDGANAEVRLGDNLLVSVPPVSQADRTHKPVPSNSLGVAGARPVEVADAGDDALSPTSSAGSPAPSKRRQNYKRPEMFSGKAIDLHRWLRKFEFYLRGAVIHPDDQSLEVTAYMDDATLERLGLADPDSLPQPWSAMRQYLWDHFFGADQSAAYHAQVAQCVQQPGESIEAYGTRLKDLVRLANHRKQLVTPDGMYEQFVRGLLDPYTRRTLEREQAQSDKDITRGFPSRLPDMTAYMDAARMTESKSTSTPAVTPLVAPAPSGRAVAAAVSVLASPLVPARPTAVWPAAETMRQTAPAASNAAESTDSERIRVLEDALAALTTGAALAGRQRGHRAPSASTPGRDRRPPADRMRASRVLRCYNCAEFGHGVGTCPAAPDSAIIVRNRAMAWGPEADAWAQQSPARATVPLQPPTSQVTQGSSTLAAASRAPPKATPARVQRAEN